MNQSEENSDDHGGYSDDAAQQYAFERLMVEDPILPIVSLHKKRTEYYILCSADPLVYRDRDGLSIEQRILNVTSAVHPLAIPVSKVPEGAISVPLRSIAESSVAQGFPRTRDDLIRDCKVLLPSDFPAWIFSINHGSWPLQTKISSEMPLSAEQKEALNRVFRRLHGTLFQLHFECSPLPTRSEFSFWDPRSANGTTLIVSGRKSPESERSVKWALEEDEDFWRDNHSCLFEQAESPVGNCLPKDFENASNSCYVGGLPTPNNIRLYLSLYRSVNLELPLEHYNSEFWHSLKVSSKDLIELARRGRVRFVLPFSVSRHPKAFLLEILEAVPSSVLFPRRLSAAVVNDTRQRFPLAYPAATATEKRAIILGLKHFGQRLDTRQADHVDFYCRALSRMWTLPELEISRDGVLGAVSCGIAPIIAGLLRGSNGQDLSIEVSSAAFGVQIGGALGSSVFPDNLSEPTSTPFCDLCAAFLSGPKNHVSTERTIELQAILTGLSCLNNDMPVLELDDCFSGGDIDRLRNIVFSLAEKNQDLEMRQDAINNLNKAIRQLERRENRIEKFDIFNATVAALPAVINTQLWAISLILAATNVILKGPDVRGNVGKLFDLMRSPLVRTFPKAIFINRIRKRLR